MNVFTYIKNHVFIKIKPSKIHGVGIFALVDIPTPTFLFQPWLGDTGVYPLTQDELKELPRSIRDHVRESFSYSTNFPTDSSIYVPLTHGCHWLYTNPLALANSGMGKSNVDVNTGISIKPIITGEEILSNYGRYQRAQIKTKLL